MDLSKAFDCLPHDLSIAKLETYGSDRNTLKLFYSYLKDRNAAINFCYNYPPPPRTPGDLHRKFEKSHSGAFAS